MAIQTEIWAADIAENLFKDDSFIRQSRNDDAFVNNAKVHLPQSGTVPGVERDRNSFPASIAARTDTTVEYDIIEFTSDPTLIRDIEEIETSYNKRQNVLMDHTEQLSNAIGDYFAYIWGTDQAANIVDTTSTATRVGSAPGATGTRKRMTKEDVLSAKALLDAANIPQEGRVMLVNSEMYNDLLRDDNLLSADYMNQGNLPSGAITRILGFNIYMRSHVGAYANASNTPKDPTAATAATDNAYALLWHPRFVRAANAGVKVYADNDKPEYYGSVFSAMVRAGGSKSYTNHRGVVAIREAS